MGRRRRVSRQADDQRLGDGGAQHRESTSDRAGPRRSDSAQAGVARLAEVAGNQAVAGMLGRFFDGEETQVEDGGGAQSFFEPIVEQEEAPTAPVAQQGGGGEQFTIADDADQGTGGGSGDRFVFGDNLDQGAGPATPEAGPHDLQIEIPTREERAQAREAAGESGGGASIPARGGGQVFAAHLKERVGEAVKDADAQTRALAVGLAEAVGAAWSIWQSATSINAAFINGPTVSGGQLIGPPLGVLIRSQAASSLDRETVNAVANTIEGVHEVFKTTFKFAGTPAFPPFAAIPGPTAPPTPSIPMPVAATSALVNLFLGLENRLVVADPATRRAAQAVAAAMFGAVSLWSNLALINLVGQGPVPSFAPPYVPVGPVVGGIANGGITGG